MKTVVKKLPTHMTVQNLKGLLQRLYKIDTSCQKVSYCDKRVGDRCHFVCACILCFFALNVDDYAMFMYTQGGKEFEVEMNDNLKTLSFYSMVAGDTILLKWN